MSLVSAISRNLQFRLDPETAHVMSIYWLKTGLAPISRSMPDPRLAVTTAGLVFPNPVGLAAGYDKNAAVPDAVLKMGFGFAEIGSVTPHPQTGNDKPRIFRLAGHNAVINRLGFNNQGYQAVLARLAARHGKGGIVGVNIGANKDSTDFIADYELGIETFWPVASYFTANVSSPNTPGLRNMQAAAKLRELLKRLLDKRDQMAVQTAQARAVFVKIAPDLEQQQMEEIAKVISASALDGLIVSNTTLSRVGVESDPNASQAGGMSGQPLFERSTITLARMRQLLGERLPIIGVGGINDTASALAKLEAGATLLQLYTGMIYRGPMLADEICKGLAAVLEYRCLQDISALTGSRNGEWASRKLPGES